MSDSALEVIGLYKNFGALEVAHNIDFTLKRGARHALIGPNGAGKTTFINLITGVLAPSSGQIILNGQDITGLGEAERKRFGRGWTRNGSNEAGRGTVRTGPDEAGGLNEAR